MSEKKQTLNAVQKKVDKAREKRDKLQAELDDAQKELALAEKEYKQLRQEQSLNNIAKALFTDNSYSNEQVDTLIALINKFGADIDQIDIESINLKKGEIKEKEKVEVDTNINSLEV